MAILLRNRGENNLEGNQVVVEYTYIESKGTGGYLS